MLYINELNHKLAELDNSDRSKETENLTHEAFTLVEFLSINTIFWEPEMMIIPKVAIMFKWKDSEKEINFILNSVLNPDENSKDDVLLIKKVLFNLEIKFPNKTETIISSDGKLLMNILLITLKMYFGKYYIYKEEEKEMVKNCFITLFENFYEEKEGD